MSVTTLAERIARIQPRIESVSPAGMPKAINADELHLVPHDSLAKLGITLAGSPSNEIYINNTENKVGNIHLEIRGNGNTIILDNNMNSGVMNAHVRIFHDDCICVLSKPNYGVAALGTVAMRSPEQCFYWGPGATSVGMSVEIEGRGRSVLVGEDALISSGIWIRNHDMHSIVDMKTGLVRNPEAVDTVIEPHVWIGQDVLVLGCPHIGYGSILAAKALVRESVPATSAVAGVPARVVRSDISWGRDLAGQSPREVQLLRACAEKLQVAKADAGVA